MLFYCDAVLHYLHSLLMLIINGIYPFIFVLERDAFDALFDNAPEKLNVVKKVHALVI